MGFAKELLPNLKPVEAGAGAACWADFGGVGAPFLLSGRSFSLSKHSSIDMGAAKELLPNLKPVDGLG